MRPPHALKHITEQSGSLIRTVNLSSVPFREDYALVPCEILGTNSRPLPRTHLSARVLPLLWVIEVNKVRPWLRVSLATVTHTLKSLA